MDGLVLLLFLLPLCGEVMARSGPLDAIWDAGRLSGEGDDSWRRPAPAWEGACGAGGGAGGRTLVFAGGSSTGGAYQFRNEPDAFFPAQALRVLCSSMGAGGAALRGRSYGRSGADSFTISRTLDQMLQGADRPILVLYLGVNDLFTRSNRQTRAEREGAGGSGIAAWAAHSRLLTGLALWMRPTAAQDALSLAQEVPIPDALENHRRMIAAVQQLGGSVLLATEYVQVESRPLIAPYAAMQRGLAAPGSGVQFMDVDQELSGMSPAELLVDQNHLSRAGNRILGERMAVRLQAMLEGR